MIKLIMIGFCPCLSLELVEAVLMILNKSCKGMTLGIRDPSRSLDHTKVVDKVIEFEGG